MPLSPRSVDRGLIGRQSNATLSTRSVRTPTPSRASDVGNAHPAAWLSWNDGHKRHPHGRRRRPSDGASRMAAPEQPANTTRDKRRYETNAPRPETHAFQPSTDNVARIKKKQHRGHDHQNHHHYHQNNHHHRHEHHRRSIKNGSVHYVSCLGKWLEMAPVHRIAFFRASEEPERRAAIQNGAVYYVSCPGKWFEMAALCTGSPFQSLFGQSENPHPPTHHRPTGAPAHTRAPEPTPAHHRPKEFAMPLEGIFQVCTTTHLSRRYADGGAETWLLAVCPEVDE